MTAKRCFVDVTSIAQCEDEWKRKKQRKETKKVLIPPKVQSVLRGLDHASTCKGCSSVLCRSTYNFMRKIEVHSAVHSHAEAAAAKVKEILGCNACKLWLQIVEAHRLNCCRNSTCNVPDCSISTQA